jgi:predicted RNA methylase
MIELDKYYTKEDVALNIFNFLDKKYNLKNYFLFEPSAGAGSFSDLFHKNSIAIDKDPGSIGITRIDFLNNNWDIIQKENVFVIGNPPFGYKYTKAVEFIKKSSHFANKIAFIVPKDINLNILDNFIITENILMNNDIFIYNNQGFSVPTRLIVWEKIS